MLFMLKVIYMFAFLLLMGSCYGPEARSNQLPADQRISKTKKEWKSILTPQQYHILREKGTEKPYAGSLLYNKEKGIYICTACGHKLFSSESKYDSGTGWPSFYEPYSMTSLAFDRDHSYGMLREELLCARCGSHLGHVFDDGPDPTGLRHCINSTTLKFVGEK